MLSQEFDIDSWVCSIRALDDLDIQQSWYSNLLGQLNLQALDGSDADLDAMLIIVEELTDQDLQNTWRSNIDCDRGRSLLMFGRYNLKMLNQINENDESLVK